MTTCLASCEFPHSGIGNHWINVSHLLPEITGSPSHAVPHPIVLGDVAPAGATTLRTEELFKPFITEDQHRVSLNQQTRFFIIQAPLLELLRREEVEEILLAIAFNALLGMGWTAQVTTERALTAA